MIHNAARPRTIITTALARSHMSNWQLSVSLQSDLIFGEMECGTPLK